MVLARCVDIIGGKLLEKKMKRGNRYRILHMTPEQHSLKWRYYGCCRYVFNTCLAANNEWWQKNKDNPKRGNFDFPTLAQMKKEKPWLNEPNAQALNAEIANLKKASPAGRPVTHG